jgi:hypothetical protein
VTLELWSDPENDGEAELLLGAGGARRPRARARARDGAPVDRPARGVPRRRRRGWLADHAAGPDAEPVRALQRQRAPGRDARARRGLGSETLATGHYARVSEGPGLLRPRRPGEGPELRAGRARARVARAPALPAGRAAQAAGARARRAGGPGGRPQAPTPRTCASSRAPARGVPGAPRRPRSAPGPIVDQGGCTLGEHAGAHTYTVGQRHGLGISRRGEPLYVLATDTRPNTVVVGPREELLAPAMRVREMTLHRDGATSVDGRALCARTRRLSPAALAGARRRAPRAAGIELSEAAERTAPGQLAVPVCGRARRRARDDRGVRPMRA